MKQIKTIKIDSLQERSLWLGSAEFLIGSSEASNFWIGGVFFLVQLLSTNINLNLNLIFHLKELTIAMQMQLLFHCFLAIKLIQTWNKSHKFRSGLDIVTASPVRAFPLRRVKLDCAWKNLQRAEQSLRFVSGQVQSSGLNVAFFGRGTFIGLFTQRNFTNASRKQTEL